jgi:hypothetical protein
MRWSLSAGGRRSAHAVGQHRTVEIRHGKAPLHHQMLTRGGIE